MKRFDGVVTMFDAVLARGFAALVVLIEVAIANMGIMR